MSKTENVFRVAAGSAAVAIIWWTVLPEEFLASSFNKSMAIDEQYSDLASPNTSAVEQSRPGRKAKSQTSIIINDNPAPTKQVGKVARISDTAKFESSLLIDHSLSMQRIGWVFGSDKNFDAALSQLENQTLSDPDAMELTRVYRDGIETQAAGTKKFRVKDFACGISICIGSLTEQSTQSNLPMWKEELEKNKGLPNYLTIYTTIDSGDGTYEHRFVLSTDSGLRGVSGVQ